MMNNNTNTLSTITKYYFFNTLLWVIFAYLIGPAAIVKYIPQYYIILPWWLSAIFGYTFKIKHFLHLCLITIANFITLHLFILLKIPVIYAYKSGFSEISTPTLFFLNIIFSVTLLSGPIILNYITYHLMRKFVFSCRHRPTSGIRLSDSSLRRSFFTCIGCSLAFLVSSYLVAWEFSEYPLHIVLSCGWFAALYCGVAITKPRFRDIPLALGLNCALAACIILLRIPAFTLDGGSVMEAGPLALVLAIPAAGIILTSPLALAALLRRYGGVAGTRRPALKT